MSGSNYLHLIIVLITLDSSTQTYGQFENQYLVKTVDEANQLSLLDRDDRFYLAVNGQSVSQTSQQFPIGSHYDCATSSV